jgi:hypothetical protein
MDQRRKPSLYVRTLRAGIAVGVIGALAMIFSNLFLQNLGVVPFSGANVFLVLLTQVYLLATVACMPFSAALVAAALVMHYLDTRSVGPAEPAENPPASMH